MTQRIASGLLRSDPEIPPVHRCVLDLDGDVSGLLEGMLGYRRNEGAIQECLDHAVPCDDLDRVPFAADQSGTVKLSKVQLTDPQDIALESSRKQRMLGIRLGQSTST